MISATADSDLLKIRCLSRPPQSTPLCLGCSTLPPRRAVKLPDACHLCFGSGQRWGVKREKGGQVVTGLGQRACCFLRYSMMMLSREGGEGRWRSSCFFMAGLYTTGTRKRDRQRAG